MLGNIVLAIVIVVVAALLLWIIFSSIAIIHTGEVGIVERLGVYVKTMEPGFHIVLPIIYRITEVVNMKQIPMRVAEQEVITKDNVVVKISETLNLTHHIMHDLAFEGVHRLEINRLPRLAHLVDGVPAVLPRQREAVQPRRSCRFVERS